VGEVLAAIRAQVEHQRRLGVIGYPIADPPAAAPVPPRPSAHSMSGSLFAEPAVARAGSLPALREAIGDCRRCKLAPHRTHLVFGVGDPGARLMFVGEGPGADEDAQGEPFVGRAGQLLTEIITKGMRLRREDVYIANVIKCRPPGNRNPEPDEVEACEPFLLRQVELIGPEVVVALGKFAAQTLLRTKTPITQLRGRWFDYHGIKLMATFHPAYLLRNPAEKRVVWQDIQEVMRVLGLRVARR
jgi:uracil-DNA glycosylase family 4